MFGFLEKMISVREREKKEGEVIQAIDRHIV
jgi:hypothetical protein